MTLLDRFRSQPRQKHPDPAVRLAYVTELPLDEHDLIMASAREDDDPRRQHGQVEWDCVSDASREGLRDRAAGGTITH